MTFVSNRACFYMNNFNKIWELVDWKLDWEIGWLLRWLLIDQQIDWWFYWLTDCFVDCSMIDWLIDWQLQWLIGWVIDDFVDWLVDWLRNSVTDRLIGWLMTLLIEWWSIYWLIEAVFNIFFCPQITEYKMRWMRCGKLTDIHPWKIDRSVFEQFCIKWYSPV